MYFCYDSNSQERLPREAVWRSDAWQVMQCQAGKCLSRTGAFSVVSMGKAGEHPLLIIVAADSEEPGFVGFSW